jgi:hypothetical protein
MLAKRRGWARRTPNMYGDRARVLVPAGAVVQPRSASFPERAGDVITRVQANANGPDQVHDRVHDQANRQPFERAVENAIILLREQLERERDRVNRAEAQVAELRTALDDAVAAGRVAASEAAALRAELEQRRTWGFLRRLRGALRGA